MHKNRFVRLVVSGLVLSLAVLFGIAVPAGAAVRAGIALSASAGPAGASVTVTGAGFARQSSGTLTAGSTSVPFTTKDNGSFTAAVTADIVALDGNNWGTAAPWSSWTSPSALFGAGLTVLRSLAPGKPIMISETASAEAGGSKADWNTALVSYLAAQSDVTAFVWFHHNKEVDWRINSSTASTNALAAALAARNS